MINMVKKHEDLREIPEYEEDLKILTEIIKETNWSSGKIEKLHKYYLKRDRLSVLKILFSWVELGSYLTRNPGRRS